MRFLMDTISPRIKHLTEEQVHILLNRYYEGEGIKNLIEEFKLDADPSLFIRLFPIVETDEPCAYCGTKLTGSVKSRTSNHEGLKNLLNLECPKCAHNNSNYCNCSTCKRLWAQAKIEQQKKMLENALLPYKHPKHQIIKEEDLSLYELLMLCVLIRTHLSIDGNFLTPLEDDCKSLFPSNFYLIEVLKHFLEKGILKIQEDISLKNIYNGRLNILSVNLYINIESQDGSYSALINRLTYLDQKMFKENPEFCLMMWKKIVYLEIVEYVHYTMKEIKVNCNFSSRAEQSVNHLSNNFSTSEIYTMVYSTGSYIARLKLEGKFNSVNCESYVFNHIEKIANKILSGEYSRIKNKRNFKLPESSLYDVFFNYLLCIGNKGFDTVPDINILESQMQIEDKIE